MSFIQQTIQCKDCKYQMNVATGTFGYGLPRECPNCHRQPNYETIAQGWHAVNHGKKE